MNQYLHIIVGAALLCAGSSLQGDSSSPELLQRIAFGSCADQNLPQPIWEDVLAVKPDLFLALGDNIYADTEDMDLLAEKYAKLGSNPAYRKLRALCPMLATWDDHDYGVNDGDVHYPRKAESKKIMLDFYDVPADAPQRKRDGVYQAAIFGPPGKRLQVILLDTRYFRSTPVLDQRTEEEKKRLNIVGWYVPNHDPSTTMLGAEQWRWLEEQLGRPAEVRLIVSSMQVIAGEKGMESWGNFPRERRRLYRLIEKTEANGVCFLSGDVHFSEISRTDEGPYPIFEFTSSGITNSEPIWAAAINPHRVSQIAYAKPTFGLVEIDWDQSPVRLTMKAIGVGGEIAIEMAVQIHGAGQAH